MGTRPTQTKWGHLPGRIRPWSNPDGYLYVIQFSDDVIKVGRTVDPRARFISHASEATRRGARMTDWWLSPPGPGHIRGEEALIRDARASGRVFQRAEYFTGCSFEHLICQAARHMELASLRFHAASVQTSDLSEQRLPSARAAS